MNLMNLSHSKALRMTYLASIRSGFPFTNLAWTSTVEKSPSSSIINKPVMSPSSSEDSNTEGVSKTKVAVPEDPSFDRVSLTSGTLGSSIPLINWRVAALQQRCWLYCCCRRLVSMWPAHMKWCSHFTELPLATSTANWRPASGDNVTVIPGRCLDPACCTTKGRAAGVKAAVKLNIFRSVGVSKIVR